MTCAGQSRISKLVFLFGDARFALIRYAHTQNKCWFKPLTADEVCFMTLRLESERKFTGPMFFEETNADPYANLILTNLVKESGNIDRTALPLTL
jgi:hypothetical protein